MTTRWFDETNARSILISASCTTSWFDWIHGELWLCPNGVLRRSVGLMATLLHGRGATLDPTNRPTRVFTESEITEIVAAGRRNRWIPWSANVASSTIRCTSSLVDVARSSFGSRSMAVGTF